MRILFFTHGKVCATEGGTERTTITVATSLSKYYACKCYSLYESPLDAPKEECFIKEFIWNFYPENEKAIIYLRSIVKAYNIDIIINQGSFQHTKYIRKAIEGLPCYIVFAHHFEPLSEAVYFSWGYFISQPFPRTVKGLIFYLYQLFLFPWIKKKRIQKLASWYNESYSFADRVVLLSKSFVQSFSDFSGIKDNRKFTIIPNGLSFTEFLPLSKISEKDKIVLIVSRLDDRYKNISLALNIWNKVIQKNKDMEGWTLKIVGHGPDKNNYQRQIQKMKIPNVSLEGRQDPVPYYKKASIFLMTSNSESWGLTLTEAMQFGVIPVALNTYASLSEIINNNCDGIIVPPDDIKGFEQSIVRLIRNEPIRKKMALNAIENVKRFSQEQIAKKWHNLFLDLLLNDHHYD